MRRSSDAIETKRKLYFYKTLSSGDRGNTPSYYCKMIYLVNATVLPLNYGAPKWRKADKKDFLHNVTLTELIPLSR